MGQSNIPPTHAATPCPHDTTVSPPVMSQKNCSVVASLGWRDGKRVRQAGAWNVGVNAARLFFAFAVAQEKVF
jgi:hypothetical protein